MRIYSEYHCRVFWRMFVPGDTTYIVGWREGFIDPCTWVNDINFPEGQFQLEIKEGGLFSRVLVHPGMRWSNTDELRLTREGNLDYYNP
jgi:hypothetical protein